MTLASAEDDQVSQEAAVASMEQDPLCSTKRKTKASKDEEAPVWTQTMVPVTISRC